MNRNRNWNHRVKFGLTLFFLTVFLCSPALPGQAAAPGASDPPAVSLVEPASAPNDLDTPITISGSNFSSDATVSLGSHLLTGVVFVSDTNLTAKVPWGLDAGGYTLTVTSSGGQASIPFTVTQSLGLWNTGDLFGGPVHDMVMVPGSTGSTAHLYAQADTGGIFYSSDGGENWTLRGNVQNGPGSEITLAVDPANEQNLYYASNKSSDGGAHWSCVMDGCQWVNGKRLGDLVRTYIHGSDRYVISAVGADSAFAGEEGAGIARSTDGGLTWTGKMTGLTDTNVTALAFVPGEALKMYAGTSSGRLFFSADGGDSWIPFLDITGSRPGWGGIGLLEVNPTATGELWVSTNSSFSNAGAMIKIDRDTLSITQVWGDPDLNNDQTRERPKSITFTAAGSAYLGCGWDRGFTTSDGGAIWTDFYPTANKPKPGWKILYDENSGGKTFYMPDERYGVQKTMDDGATWAVKNHGIQAIVPSQMAVDPTDPAVVYAKIRSDGWPGIFRTTDGGAHWSFLELAATSNGDPVQINSIAVDSSGRLYAGAMGPRGTLYISQDQGNTWADPVQVVTNPVDGHAYHPSVIKAKPQQPGTLLMVIGQDIGLEMPEQVYRSTDYGVTWTKMDLSDNGQAVYGNWGMDLVFDPQNADKVYLPMENKRLYVSLDGGATWTLNQAFAAANIAQGYPITVESLPPYRVAAGNGYTDDGGITWKLMNSSPGCNAMAFLPRSATLYCGGTNGLYVSLDAGMTWQPVPGPMEGVNIQSLAVADLLDRDLIYVGTSGGSSSVASTTKVTPMGTSSLVAAGTYRYAKKRFWFWLPLVVSAQ